MSGAAPLVAGLASVAVLLWPSRATLLGAPSGRTRGASPVSRGARGGAGGVSRSGAVDRRAGGGRGRLPLVGPGHRRADAVSHEVARDVLARLAGLLRSGAEPRRAWAAVAASLQADGLRPAGPRPDGLRWPGNRGPSGHIARAEAQARWARFATRRAATPVRGGSEAEDGIDGAHPDEAMLAVLWCQRLAERSGAPLATLVENASRDAAARSDAVRARIAASAAARSTRRILLCLPLLGLGMAQLLGGNPVAILVTDPVGRLVGGLGVALWLAATLWSRRLLAGAGSPRRRGLGRTS